MHLHVAQFLHKLRVVDEMKVNGSIESDVRDSNVER